MLLLNSSVSDIKIKIKDSPWQPIPNR